MKTESDLFLKRLDAQIQSKHLLHHDFYQAWSRGELSMDCLREYAKDYYHHVKAFPTYLSAIHCRMEDEETRRILLQNLIEEEAGSPNHPELWKDFALRLGVKEEEFIHSHPSTEMKSLISLFRKTCMQGAPAEAIAALYAYESQIPAVSLSKIKGLQEHYAMVDPKDWQYFTVHIAADEQHAAQERSLLKKYLEESAYERVFDVVNEVLDHLQNFLSGLCRRHQVCQLT